MDNVKIRGLVILSFILSFTPIVSGILVLREKVSIIPGFLLAVIGIGFAITLRWLLLNYLPKSREKYFEDKIAVVSIVMGLIFLFLWMIYIPGAVTIKSREKEATVKSVESVLQACVEEYKSTHHGERPKNLQQVENYFPELIKNPKFNLSVGHLMKLQNPFNPKQTYTLSSGGLVDGEPRQSGQVGFIAPQNDTERYQIIAYIIHDGKKKLLLHLVEGKP